MELAEQQKLFNEERLTILTRHDADKGRLREQCRQELQLLLNTAQKQRDTALDQQLTELTIKFVF